MKFVLVVNPHSGKKQGNEILAMVKPIFDRAGTELTIIETVFPGHARELATRIELAEFDGLLTLGGDGTFHEIVTESSTDATETLYRWESFLAVPEILSCATLV